ncbi:MAG: SDR family oxidoreductase [Hyphomicrobium sp.]|jgi:nucleoside-diphosphate-sugar epimerase
MHNLFCFGLGYSAEAFARRVAREGWQVAGTSRSEDGMRRIKSLGYEAILFDGQHADPAVDRVLAAATHILVSASPDEAGDPVLRHYAPALAATGTIQWIGYLSTIGVYGDTGGAWIDEETPARPGSDRTKRRVDAENAWLDLGRKAGKRVEIYRLGGIYGPGRSAIEDVRNGTARRIIKPGQVFNRIHVDDIANVLRAGAAGLGTHSIYNVTDDEPAPPQDVVLHAAELQQLPAPPEVPFETAPLSPMGRSFYSENRRVGNRRLHEDLGVELAFPSYREGLRAILTATQR